MRLPQPRPVPLPTRLAGEVAAMVRRLEEDRELGLIYFNQYRDRTLLCGMFRHDWRAEGVAVLLDLDADATAALDALYDEADRVALWMDHTEDMPQTVSDRLDAATRSLRALAEKALGHLGEPPPPPPSIVWPAGWTTLHR